MIKTDIGTISTGCEAEERVIWSFFKNKGLKDEAVAGIMGNLNAESALRSNNLQQSYECKLGHTDESYTEGVDNGSYTNFVHDKAGYGLAQWTYWSRKENLLKFAQAAGKSIADLQMQLDFLWKELQGYTRVMTVLHNAESVREASDVILIEFESPADQSELVQVTRAAFGQRYYDKYAAQKAEPEHWYRIRKSWDDPASQIAANKNLEQIKAGCPEGYSVYDWNGNCVYYNGGGEFVTDTSSLEEFVRGIQKACGAAVDGIAGAETLRKTVTLSAKHNTTHAVVKPVQERLYALGYHEVGEADGEAGPKFTSAVAHFQQDNDCTPTGIMEEWGKTWHKLLGAMV